MGEPSPRRSFQIALSLVLACASFATAQLPRLTVKDGHVVDPAGAPVTLRGVNLGNWLLIEPGGLGNAMGRFPDQANLFDVLRDRFGETERRRLIDVYRDSYITARDFDAVKSFGFNVVRVGFDHELLEDVGRPWELRPDAFKYLDFAVAEAKKRDLHVLFDLHGAQGRQVSGKQSGEIARADFWTVPDNQQRSLWLWETIIAHFKGDPTVLGYEMLNEPFSGKEEQVLDYAKRWYSRVRPVDPEAIMLFPGLNSGVGFYGDPAAHGWTNVMFDLHYYPGVSFAGGPPSTPDSAAAVLRRSWPRLAERLKAIRTPAFIGELSIVYKSGGGGEMLRRYTDAAADYGWPVTIWTLKELSPKGGVGGRMWMLVTNANPIPPVDIHTSGKGEIEAAFHSLATMPLVTDPDALHWQTVAQRPAPLPATRPTADEPPPEAAAGEPTTRPAK